MRASPSGTGDRQEIGGSQAAFRTGLEQFFLEFLGHSRGPVPAAVDTVADQGQLAFQQKLPGFNQFVVARARGACRDHSVQDGPQRPGRVFQREQAVFMGQQVRVLASHFACQSPGQRVDQDAVLL